MAGHVDGYPQTLLPQCCSQRQACAAVLSSASPLCTVNKSFDDIQIFDRKRFHQRHVGSSHSCFRARLGLATRLFCVKVNLGFRSQPVQKRIPLPWKVHINNKLIPNVTELAPQIGSKHSVPDPTTRCAARLHCGSLCSCVASIRRCLKHPSAIDKSWIRSS